MGLKGLYTAGEDKYYALLDWMDKHGLPVYSIIDKIEAQNIPTFPLAVLVTFLVLVGLFTALGGGSILVGNTLNVLAQDDTQNPLANVSIQIQGDNVSRTLLTDATGNASFSGLAGGQTITVRATSDTHTFQERTLIVSSSTPRISLIGSPTNVITSIALQVYRANSSESYLESVTLQFACSGDATYSETRTSNTGLISLSVPGSCGTLTAISLDDRVRLESGIIDLESNQPAVYVVPPVQGNGIIRVTVINEQTQPIAGATINILNPFGDVLYTQFTDPTGFAEFRGLVEDTYVVGAYDDLYAPIESAPTQVMGNAPATITLTMKPKTIGDVRLQIVDESTLSPVSGAIVILSRANQVVTQKQTNEGGQVTFAVSTTQNLSVGIDHPAYLKTNVPVTVSEAGYTQIGVAKATLQNSQGVTIRVVDELGKPVENAIVSLKRSGNGATVGSSKTTGAGGTVLFLSLEEGSYFASAYKPGFSDQIRSDVFEVRARENVESTIRLTIGTGNILVKVTGFDGQPLAGARLQPIDARTHQNEGNEISLDVDGTKEVTLRADKQVYFVITEGEHLPYTTLPIALKKGITQMVAAQLVKDIQRLEVRVLGTWVNTQPLLADAGLAPGQTYTIQLGLFIPRNAIFNETGMHVRTGNAVDGQTNPMENDAWTLVNIRAPTTNIQRGTTYTPPTGLGIDAQHLTSGEAKWGNIVFENPREGITIVEVDVRVKDSVAQGTDLPLFYRGWGKTGSFVRFPVDAVLAGAESTQQKQGLYANTNLASYSVGASASVCSQEFCAALVMEDIANGLQTPLLGDTTLDIGTRHKMLFTIHSTSEAVLQDTSLVIQSSSGSASLGAFEVTNAVGAKRTGNVAGNKAEIPVGIIQQNNVVFGFVNVDASKEGTSIVSLKMVSNKKELFSRDVVIRVDAAEVFTVEIVPKAILPLLSNQILVRVTKPLGETAIPLENVNVQVLKNSVLHASGFTDGEGIFPFELNEPNVNDKLDITLSKPGYKPVTISITVGADILLFQPAQLNETLIINGTGRKAKEVRALNLASIPLVIRDVKLSGDFEELVRFDLITHEVIGETLPVNGDANIQFTLDLTDKGRKLLAAKTFKGSLLVIVENEASGKVFTNALPLTLKLGFGGEVDVEDCLLVQPVTWDAFVGTKERKQQAFEIKNTCTVKGVPVRLTDLAVKVKQLAGNSLGTFTGATTQETKTLGAAYETVLDAIPANGEAIVTITFAPGDILSGVAQPQIVFRATNLTGTGFPDHLEKTVTMNLVVNDLTQCVRVNAPPILEIETCALNTGFSQMSNYYNQVYRPTGVPYFNPGFQTLNQTSNPSGTSAIPSNITYGSPFFTGTYPGAYGPGGVDGFGNMGPYSAQFTPQSANYFAGAQGPFANPNFDRYNYAPGAGGQFGCAGTEFRIENACQSEVQIVLDVDPNLQSSQGTFSLKPTQTQRVFVQPGYRIGKYGVNVNARAQGSTDPSTEVAFISVLVRSPTEVNQDCISLNTTKYRFNDFIQKPVKGKVYNNCYDEGVRLVPSADTVTIASLKDAKGNTTLDPKQGVSQQPNSLVQDIQIIGISTQGDGRDTVQVLEFQIFPDLTTYQHQLSPFDQGGSFPKQVLDLKFFAELNYYRVESYGTISVKYLDPYGGPQQKPFPVIFENLFNLASAINPLLQGGSESITNYSECVNEDALRFRAIGTDTGAAALEFGDAEFQGQTILTHTTKAPNAVLKTGIIDGKEFCGQVDYIRSVTPTILTSRQNPSVQAIFSVSGKHDLQVQINRPLNLTQEAVIEGILTLEVTRTIANPGTQKVSLPVRIVIKPVGKPSTAIFTPQACTETGYEKGPGFVSKYGFDRLTWDWTYEGSPDCTQYFCDATQFMIFTSKRLKEFDTFVKANQASGLFSDADKDYTSQNFVLAIHDQITVTDDQTTGKPTRSFFVNSAGDGVVKETTSSQSAKLLIDNVFTALSNAPNLNEVPADYTSYVAFVKQKFEEIQNNAAGNKLAEQLVIVLDADKVSRLVATGIKGMGADEVTFPNGEKKYVWLFSEFRHFFDESNKINPTLCGTDCWALASLTQPGDSHQFTPGVYRAIYDAVESVQVGMLVPTDTEAEAWDAARLGYVLSHARQKGGLTFQDTAYADIDSLRGRFVDMNVYMMQDAFSQFLLSDLAFVSGEGYDYPAAFNNQMLTNLDIIQRMLISPPVPEAGLYPASFVATWENDSDGVKSLAVRIKRDAVSYLSLGEIDTQLNSGNTAYADNPFFRIPFNGKTGVGRVRSGYGVGLSLPAVSAGMPYRDDSVGFTSSIPSTGVPLLTLQTYETISAIGDLVAAQGVPTFFRLEGRGGGYSFQYAPSTPAPIRLRMDSPASQPALQYTIVESGQAAIPPGVAINGASIRWIDCANPNGIPVSSTTGPTCNTGRPGDFSLVGDLAGNEYVYTGMAFIPPEKNYRLLPACTTGTADVKTISNTVGLPPASPSTQVQFMDLRGPAAAPQSLQDILARIQTGQACGDISKDVFTVIWDLASEDVVPAALQCTAT